MTFKLYFPLLTAAAMTVFCCCNSNNGLTKSGLDPLNFEGEYQNTPTTLHTLTNSNGMEVCITNFGGRIVSALVPDRNGNFKDVVLGFDKVSDYYPDNNLSDFGAAIGRYANRIAGGHLEIDGNVYALPLNDNGHNCLHGGFSGWQYQAYEIVEADSRHIRLLRKSADNDNGFPGNVEAFVTYTLTEDNSIEIDYEATTDAPTVINMTNHSYFNLAGDPAGHSVCDDYLYIDADAYTPTDEWLIPTGKTAAVEGTPMDFRQERKIGDYIDCDFEALKLGKGIDHNWVLNNQDSSQPDVILRCGQTGIVLSVYTDEPGIQVYTGNFLDGTLTGKGGVVYNWRTGICLESQHFPDSPNRPEWPSTVLRPGETYTSRCVFAFSVAE